MPRGDFVARTVEALVHRGPDGQGVYSAPSRAASIGMCRLSIVDLADGRQPQLNERQSVAVVFNGEIYNHGELRAELERHGHEFATRHSDTEVIVHGYEQWGLDAFKRLSGMFAIAIWDEHAKRGVLARDPVGKKPLYWIEHDDVLYFASEATPLARELGLTTLSKRGIADVLHHGYPTAGTTIWHGMRMLPPGTVMEIRASGMKSDRYWMHPRSGVIKADRRTAVEQVDRLLREAVHDRLQADVPVGLFLSGGIDSSLLAALASVAGAYSPRTFSVVFGDEREDESKWSALVAREFGCEHVTVDGDDVDEPLLRSVIRALDEPIADAATVPTYVVASLAARHVKAVLSGEGADELFYGYDEYVWQRRAEPLLAVAARVPTPTLSRLRSRRMSYLVSAAMNGRIHEALREKFSPAEVRRLSGLECCVPDDGEAVAGSQVERAGRHDFEHLLTGDLLMKVDKMTMAHGLEARAPYLDRRLVEYVLSLPTRIRIGRRDRPATKPLLRAVAQHYLPAAILDRPKHPFLTPTDRWIEHVPKAANAAQSALGRIGIVVPDDVFSTRAKVLDIKLTRRQRWTLFVLGLWLDEHPDACLGEPHDEIPAAA